MSHSRPFLRATALLLGALGLSQLPALLPPAVTAQRGAIPPGAPVRADKPAAEATAIVATLGPAEPAVKTTRAPRSVAPPPSLPPDSVFTLSEGAGAPREFAVALDELYLPARPTKERLVAIPAQPDLAGLLRYVANRERPASGPAENAEARLVLYPVGAERNAATRRIVSPRIEVALADAATPSPPARPELGISAWERPAYAPDRALARVVGDPALPLRAASAATSLPGVRSARPLLARQHFPRLVPNDPLFRDQWHLRNTGQQGGRAGVDIRAVPAWDSATGAGVTIGIVDDGVEFTHPDLSPGYEAALDYDWNDNDNNAAPVLPEFEGDNHGTAVAGLAAARFNNGVGVAGSAPASRLTGLRLISAPSDDSEDAAAMAWRNDAIQVKNNSWGPPDASPDPDPELNIDPDVHPPGPLWLAAVEDAVATGRDGLGTLFFWSAGNGQRYDDQGSLDGYASARPVIAVAATNNAGAPAVFSEGGPHVVVAAPGDARIGIVTTDRVGDGGFNTTTFGFENDYVTQIDYTRGFGGSSAAAPIASGVGALLLEVRPDLGWRDVKEILLRSSTRLQASSSDWTTRAAGNSARPIKHHPRFGGGLLNALDALALARTWQVLPSETSIVRAASISVPAPIPDPVAGQAAPAPLSADFEFPTDGPVLRVEHAVLTLRILHPYRGDLEITLTSPSGVVSRFTAVNGYLGGADYDNYAFTSVRHWGEPSRGSGKWTLRVRDGAALDAGQLYAATLRLHGTPLTAPAVVLDPEDQALATGSTLVLRAGFSGGNLSYQWTRNNVPIRGATSPEYRLANFSTRAAGTYACVATSEFPGFPTASASAVVSVDDTSRGTLFFARAGSPTEFVLPANERPTDGRIAGLPPGLVYEAATGRIHGTPARAGKTVFVLVTRSPDGIVVRRPVDIEIAPVGFPGTWRHEGVVARQAAVNAELGGTISLLLDGATGNLTGILRNGAETLAFRGRFGGPEEEDPFLTVTLPRRGRTSLILTLRMGTGDVITGSVADGEASAALDLRRVPWTRTAPYEISFSPRFTFGLFPKSEFLDDAPLLLPGGDSVGFGTVRTDGLVTWELRSADGAPALRGSAYVREDGVFTLYARAAAPAGSVLGTLQLGQSSSSNSTITWRRAANTPTTRLPYTNGIPLHDLDGWTTPYIPSAAQNFIGGQETSTPISLVLERPSVEVPGNFGLTRDNRVLVASGTSTRITLRGVSANGRLSGTLLLPDLSSAPLTIEAVYAGGTAEAIIGFFILPPSAEYGLAPLSGSITIRRPPPP